MRRLLSLSALALVATLGVTGVATAQPAREIPPLQAEPPPPPPPGPRYVWEPGHWHWRGGGYVWIGGHYILPHPGWHQFVPGHWSRGGEWIPAHWR